MNRVVLLIITLLLSGVGEVFAAAWNLPKGKLWTKLTYFQQSTDEWYVASRQIYRRGDRQSKHAHAL